MHRNDTPDPNPEFATETPSPTPAECDEDARVESNPDLRVEIRPLSTKTGRSVIAVVAHDFGPAIVTYVISLFDEKARTILAKKMVHEQGIIGALDKLEEAANWLWSESY